MFQAFCCINLDNYNYNYNYGLQKVFFIIIKLKYPQYSIFGAALAALQYVTMMCNKLMKPDGCFVSLKKITLHWRQSPVDLNCILKEV